MSVGAPTKKNDFVLHYLDGLSVYVEKSFLTGPSKILIQLHKRTGNPRLVASRRGGQSDPRPVEQKGQRNNTTSGRSARI